MTKGKPSFVRRLSEAHARLRNAIAGLDEATLDAEPIVGDWTIKDVLGHVVSWNDEFRCDIQAILRGEHPGYERQIDARKNFDEANQQWVSQKRSWTWPAVSADLDRDYRETLDLVLALQPEDYRRRGVTPWKLAARSKPAEPTRADTDSVLTLLTYHWRHMNEHARALERWRAKRSKGIP